MITLTVGIVIGWLVLPRPVWAQTLQASLWATLAPYWAKALAKVGM